MHYPVGYNRSLMIVLLVAYFIRAGRCSPEDAELPTSDAAEVADKTAATADSTDSKTDPITDPATAATDQPPTVDDGKPSTFSKCKVELYKSLSTIGRGAGMFLKGFGQAALSVMGALFGAFNGLLSISATTGEKVASGVNLVNNAAGRIVLVRDVTGGAATLATNLATTNRLNSEFIIENRDKLFDSLDKRLDNYHPESEKFLIAPTTDEGGTDGKSTDTTAAAAAPPTNEGAQATTAEAAPATTPPVQS
ncbi:uncharacterized protein LOC100569669 isoform X1 [Acyrthosiphon pisum]|uniref:Uncharacterized protein n=1 Tax=Acyrthosiphon pisum TaxID=7029 RepID=A0A8R1W5W1_ACYPI|nr:uncharacterized protein LOC100569669 isoform X1 [Acyrthosiphon pisum]|eukprot:XP_003245632.1 PREDICTED: uncharacterized protein LOC100569669 isoform X1 [Acyrthosiphon pisum]